MRRAQFGATLRNSARNSLSAHARTLDRNRWRTYVGPEGQKARSVAEVLRIVGAAAPSPAPGKDERPGSAAADEKPKKEEKPAARRKSGGGSERKRKKGD